MDYREQKFRRRTNKSQEKEHIEKEGIKERGPDFKENKEKGAREAGEYSMKKVHEK